MKERKQEEKIWWKNHLMCRKSHKNEPAGEEIKAAPAAGAAFSYSTGSLLYTHGVYFLK